MADRIVSADYWNDAGAGGNVKSADYWNDAPRFNPSSGEEAYPSVPEPPPSVASIAQQHGINTEGAPAKVRAILAFGREGEEHEQRNAEIALNDYFREQDPDFKGGIAVRRGPHTGEMEFKHPEKGWTLLKGAGLNAGDLAALGPTVSSGAAQIGASFLTPWTPNMGAGGAEFVHELARLQAGHAMGLNQDMTPEEMITEAGKSAAWTIGGGVVTKGLLNLSKGVANIFAGRNGLPKKLTVKEIEDAQAAFKPTMDEINQTLENAGRPERLTPTAADITGDPQLLAEKKARMGTPGRAGGYELQENEKSNRAALQAYRDIIDKDIKPAAPGTNAEVGAQAQQALKGELADETARVSQPAAQAEAQAKGAAQPFTTAAGPIEGVKPGTEILGGDIRSLAEPRPRAFTDEMAQRYKALSDRIEAEAQGQINPATGQPLTFRVTPTEFRKLGKQTNSLLNSDVFQKSLSEEDQGVVRDLLEATAPTLTARGNQVTTDLSIGQTTRALTVLKRAVREGDNGAVSGRDVSMLKRLIGALETDRANAAERLETNYGIKGVLDETKGIEDAYRQGIDQLNNGVVGKIVQRKPGSSGTYEVEDSALFNKIWNGEVRDNRQLGAILNEPGNLQQKVAMQRRIMQDYVYGTDGTNGVIQDGVVDPKRHAQWMYDHGEALKSYFQPSEIAKAKNAADMTAMWKTLSAQRDVTLEKLNAQFPSKLTEINPENIVSQLMDKENTVNARKVMAILGNRDPDALKAVQWEIRDRLTKDFSKRQGGQDKPLSFDKMHEFLSDKRNKEMLQSLYGDTNPDYMKNLNTLMDGLRVAGRKSEFANYPARTAHWLVNALRPELGVFGPEGRILTRIGQIQLSNSNRVMSNAIFDPEKLKQLVALRDVKPKTMQWAQRLGNFLGGEHDLPAY